MTHAETTIGAVESLVDRRYRVMYSLLSSQIVWAACARCWSGP